MDVMRAWLGRSVGATLLVPVGIVLAAGIVAAVGGGLGGLASLSQLATGTGLPDTALVVDADPALGDSGLAASPALGGTPAPGSGGAGASTEGTDAAAATEGGDSGGTPQTPAGDDVPRGPGGPEPGGPPSPSPGRVTVCYCGPEPGPPDLVNPPNVDEVTRGLGEALPGPLRPMTDGLLDVFAPGQ